MAWTQAQVDALKTAAAAGVRTVVYADRTVTYQSLAEMLALLAAMQAEVNGSTVDRFSRVTYSRE